MHQFSIDQSGHFCYVRNDHFGHLNFDREGFIAIHSMFNNLQSEKKQQIINAAIEEFVRMGFEKASTNEIVKRANISKGSLFNYFNSKKDLYIYLIEYSMQVLEELYEQFDQDETDLFKRIENIALQKFLIQQKHPQVFDLLASAKQEEASIVKDIIKHKVGSIYEQGIKKLYERIDYSKFKEGIDIDKAIEILNWTMFGFGEKGLKQINTFADVSKFGEQFLEEWNIYADILKQGFYK